MSVPTDPRQTVDAVWRMEAAKIVATLTRAVGDTIGGLDGSYLLPSVRGELLARLGQTDEAAAEFDRVAPANENEAERNMLRNKATRARSAS